MKVTELLWRVHFEPRYSFLYLAWNGIALFLIASSNCSTLTQTKLCRYNKTTCLSPRSSVAEQLKATSFVLSTSLALGQLTTSLAVRSSLGRKPTRQTFVWKLCKELRIHVVGQVIDARQIPSNVPQKFVFEGNSGNYFELCPSRSHCVNLVKYPHLHACRNLQCIVLS